MNNISTIILVNSFWLLFLLPGYALYRFLCNWSPKFLDDSYPLQTIIYSFFISLFLIAPLSILAYVTPIAPRFIATYIGLLFLGSIFALSWLAFKKGASLRKLFSFRITRVPLLVWVGFIAIVVDFCLSTWSRSFIAHGGDAWSHISQINYIINHGLSVYDPYFLQNGQSVIQSTHPANLSNALLALPGFTFNVSALNVWLYSAAFFRFIAFGTVFIFCRRITKNMALSLLIVFLYYLVQLRDESLLTILYPANIAFFTSVFLLQHSFTLLKERFNYYAYGIYIACIISLGLIHPVQWALTTILAGSWLLVLVIAKIIKPFRLLYLLAPFVLGLPQALYSLNMAKYIPDEVKALTDQPLHSFGHGLQAFEFNPSFIMVSLGLLIITGLLLSVRYVTQETARALLYTSLFLTFVLFYSPAFTLLNKFLPAWAIERYNYITVLAIVCMASMIIYRLIYELHSREKQPILRIFSYATIAVLLLLPFQEVSNRFVFWKHHNRQDLKVLSPFLELNHTIKPGSVILAEKWVSFIEPALCDCYVVGIDHTRTTNAIDTYPRERDTDDFFFNAGLTSPQRQAILDRYQVDTIILMNPYAARVKPDELQLKLTAKNAEFSVYHRVALVKDGRQPNNKP